MTADGSTVDGSTADADHVSTAEKLHAIYVVASYRPTVTAVVVLVSVAVTALEGVGLGFLLPIVEQARTGGTAPAGNGLIAVFAGVYRYLDVPFTLEYLVAGVAAVMTVRIALGFLVEWLGLRLQTNYLRDLQSRAFDSTLDADVEYFDRHGSDEILNALVTRVYYAESVIEGAITVFRESLLAAMYFAVALYLAPVLTVVVTVAFGGLVYVIHSMAGSAYAIGDEVDRAHERMQSAVQAGTQGIRDVKLFGLAGELFEDYRDAVDQFARSTIELGRNELLIQNAYRLITLLTVFGVIYAGLEFSSLSLGGLGVFVFAMYRLAPRINQINGVAYSLAGSLPPFIRMREFVAELDEHEERNAESVPVPDRIERVSFEDVSFFHGDDPVLREVNFTVERGEFIAFVGPSGAGKSTIVSLLAGLYTPDDGRIIVNGSSIAEFNLAEWRDSVAIVRQHPYIFDDSLRYNLTVGARDASDAAIARACDVARVTEFLDELPQGYDTELGDDGVRLSGGQRQRVAIARAILEDGDVLVLDEATSDVDTAVEERIYAEIESGKCDRTVVAITHRIATVADADRIYTVRNGRIVESGTHDELLVSGGTYAKLYTRRSDALGQ